MRSLHPASETVGASSADGCAWDDVVLQRVQQLAFGRPREALLKGHSCLAHEKDP